MRLKCNYILCFIIDQSRPFKSSDGMWRDLPHQSRPLISSDDMWRDLCRLIDSLSIIIQKDLWNKSSLINMYIWHTYESYIYFDLKNWQFNHVFLHALYYIITCNLLRVFSLHVFLNLWTSVIGALLLRLAQWVLTYEKHRANTDHGQARESWMRVY